jgi:hypothetical protein
MTTAGTIPDGVRRFLAAVVPSVPFLEAILLFRNGAAVDWAPELLAQRLYISPMQAIELARQLEAAGIVVASPGEPARYRYAPQSEALAALLGEVEATYRTSLVEVTNLIHSKSGRQAQRFADAFKFRKD